MQYGFVGLFTFLFLIGAFVTDNRKVNDLFHAIGGIVMVIMIAALFAAIDN